MELQQLIFKYISFVENVANAQTHNRYNATGNKAQYSKKH